MKAATRKRYGAPDVISVEDVPVPRPRAGEVLVRVHAATVSRTDCALLAARPFFMRFFTGMSKPRTPILGTDFAGRVEAVGEGVDDFQVGDDVWGINDLGAQSHAEYLTIATERCIGKMPANVAFADAVACIEGAWYAHSMLERIVLASNSHVLVNGATGAIGTALLQLTVHRGCHVTVVGNTKNLNLLKSLGAERVIDYEQADFTKDERVYDYVLDAVGKSSFGACRHLLTPKGVYSSTELGPWCLNPLLAMVTPALGGRRVVFPNPIAPKGFLEVIHRLVAEGHFRAVIDRSFTIDEVREAYGFAGSGQKTGSVVLQL